MEFHEYANMYPLIEGEDYENIVADMKKWDFREDEKILLCDGKILDGRNRYNAAKEANVKPLFQAIEGSPEYLIDLVISKNSNRRHLTSQDKAFAGVQAQKFYQEAAKKRMLAGKKIDPVPNLEQGSEKGRTIDKAAKKVGSSKGSIWKASIIEKEGIPEIVQAAKDSKLPLDMAFDISKLPATDQKKIIESGDIDQMRAKAKEQQKMKDIFS